MIAQEHNHFIKTIFTVAGNGMSKVTTNNYN